MHRVSSFKNTCKTFLISNIFTGVLSSLLDSVSSSSLNEISSFIISLMRAYKPLKHLFVAFPKLGSSASFTVLSGIPFIDLSKIVKSHTNFGSEALYTHSCFFFEWLCLRLKQYYPLPVLHNISFTALVLLTCFHHKILKRGVSWPVINNMPWKSP
jgi:hypothetical protein